ncbi:hypothetical protein [Marinoscillum furvescens]|uniref:Uncharacterized protein n=1 Tax=Marinoscillum furvescens DSM 4134 TaxID=1122208 RepID=A0A3D9KWX8_MARFU|nr:hypothetical protein [Marinoscillum furvescens]RED91771.1 hypothetical protein C7460_1366 [Marinoscillum furvescens DSM 4134]
MLKLYTVLTLLLTSGIIAYGQSDTDQVIMRAMQDEIERNMADLQLEDYEKPFYVSYLLSDLKKLTIQATLGGLMKSSLDSTRSWTNRVMVGNYAINDEKYEDPGINFESSGNYFNELPIDNNYDGIRRVLWLATNDVYKSAAKLYASKRELLDLIEVDSLPLPDFSKEPVINHLNFDRLQLPDQQQMEAQVLDLSQVFSGKPNFIQPMVSLHVLGGLVYFASSEETIAVFPVQMCLLSVNTQYLSQNNEFTNQSYYAFPKPEDLASELPALKEDLITFRDAIIAQDELETYEDLYFGPVMLKGSVVADFFTNNLLNRGSRSILASPTSLVKQETQQVKEQLEKLEKELTKPGPVVAHRSLQVRALPTLSGYKGMSVAGSFQVDAEGTIPPDTVTLIENGKIVEQLNGRTPAPLAPKSNGHMRLQIGYGLNIYKSLAPGVLEIQSDLSTAKDTYSVLKETAENNGLNHALSISALPLAHGYSTMVAVSKLDFDTETRTPVRLTAINLNSSNALMKLLATSPNQQLTNKLLGMGGSGLPISIIAPEEIVIDGFDYDNSPQQGYGNRNYSPSLPLPNK